MVEALQRTDTPRNESYQAAREKEQIWKKYGGPAPQSLVQKIRNKTYYVHHERFPLLFLPYLNEDKISFPWHLSHINCNSFSEFT
jgi:hypothetical protein